MRYPTKLYVPFESWPKEDRERWQAVLRKGKRLFDDSGTAAHLAEASRVSFRDAYARLIAFLTNRHKDLLGRPPGPRVNVRIIEEFIAWQPASTGPRTLANNLYWLGLMFRYMCPDRDWSWLLKISNRIAARATRRPAKHLLVTSESLYLLGLHLMDTGQPSETIRRVTKAHSALSRRSHDRAACCHSFATADPGCIADWASSGADRRAMGARHPFGAGQD
jgi:hypothetical protein